ncbi:MAG: SpoIIE family protein phosphatase [Anaerolineae bacterium]
MSNQRAACISENILIVDDTPANLRLLSQMLAEQGYGVRAATSGPRALASARAAPPDLILLDIKMPGMNGYEVCEHLKADPLTRDIPVIFISALHEIQDKVQAFAVGGVDYIAKPFQLREVLARTETHLSLRSLQKQLRDANSRMEQELSLAGRVQSSFLPGELPAPTGWQFSAALKPARQTSGDFYDTISLPDGRLGLVVADVVDKGVGAALFMTLSWILIRSYAMEHPSAPERVLRAVNDRILAEIDTGQFVTVFYGILDPATGTLTYCNAGHPPPYLFSTQGDDEPMPLTRTGMALGVTEAETWERATAHLAPGDVLILYSDGVTDAVSGEGVSFGDERLRASVENSLPQSAESILDALLARVQDFAHGSILVDDITLMIAIREP